MVSNVATVDIRQPTALLVLVVIPDGLVPIAVCQRVVLSSAHLETIPIAIVSMEEHWIPRHVLASV